MSDVRCAFFNLGGTISEVYDSGDVRRVSAAALLEAAQLPTHWPAHDISLVDSVELTFSAIFKLKPIIAADTHSRGFIVCCGTDLLDEIAFAASLLLPIDRPVVFTAAALPFSTAGTDGPAHLRLAARLAARAGNPGVYVVMSDMVFDPRGLVKLEPQAMQPYGARDGAIGRVRGEQVTLFRTPEREDRFAHLTLEDCMARVAILTECMGGGIDFADPSQLDGVVVAGAGAAGMSARTRARLRRDFLPSMPVVLSTRCAFGFSLNPDLPKYALQDARDDGFLLDGYLHLNALQARVRLILDIGRRRRSQP